AVRKRDHWDANDDGFSEIGLMEQNSLGVEVSNDLTRHTELSLKLNTMQEDRRGGDHLKRPEHDTAVSESARTRRYGAEMSVKHEVNSDVHLSAGYGFVLTERLSYYGGGGDALLPSSVDWVDLDQAEYEALQAAWDAKMMAVNAYGKTFNPVHSADAMASIKHDAYGGGAFTFGTQYLSDTLDDRAPGYNRIVNETYTDAAAFAQHEWSFSSFGESLIGVRIDKHSELEDPIFSPRAALKFEPARWLRTRTSFSTGFRAPQVFDEDLHISVVGGEGVLIENSPDLQPEHSWNISQQIEVSRLLKRPWQAQLSTNLFYTQISDYFALALDDDPATTDALEMKRYNQGLSTLMGVEVEGELSFRKSLEFRAGLTWESAKNDTPDDDFGTLYLMRTPSLYGFLMSTWRPVEGMSLGVNTDITGPMKVPHYAGAIAADKL
ncbi:TonB-dependent receptor, partial [Myxococcota bacterium]|nr:TonB-dependent receptor [Myxococcota bacterium]